MATFTATLAETGVPAKYNEKGVFAIVTSFTLAAAENNDIVNMCKMQAGVTVIGGALINAALGSNTNISVGDGGSATALLGATATSSAAGTSLIKLKTYTADDTIKLTVTTSGGATATGLVQLVLLCTADNVDLA